MVINKDLRVTDGAYYNLDLNTIAKNAIYSTDEIVVGRWINGKPIYRKFFTGQSSSSGSSSITTNIGNIDKIIKLQGTLTDGADQIIQVLGGSLSPATTEVNYSFLYYNKGNNHIEFATSDAYAKGTYNIIIEYTKSTD